MGWLLRRFKSSIYASITSVSLFLALMGSMRFIWVANYSDPNATRPKPSLYAQSDSPDGRYRCIILEQRPAPFMSSPYTYTFAIVDGKTHQPLKGETSGWYGDSTAMSPAHFVWTSKSVSILEENGSQHNAWIRDDTQIWQKVSANPLENSPFDHDQIPTPTTNLW